MTTRETISFGPYRLIPAERLLLRGEEVIEVGCRGLDILIALVCSAGDVVGQRELMARAWPDVQVGDGSLRVTIAGLRKALGDGRDGMRYIANVTGRGYCFVAHVDRSTAQPLTSISLPLVSEALPKHKLPTLLTRMVGRDDSVETLSMLLVSRRFVSVVGSGGMGKTTVAVAVAHALRDEFGGAVYFVDLGAVTNPALVASAVAAVLGVFGQAPDPLSGLVAFLGGRRLLLVLDNCEHVIEAAASMTDRIHSEAPQVHIIATSRESLRVEGEHVHFLMPLDCPPTKDDLTAVEALTTASVQLFMDRAFASGYAFDLTDADAPAVATICRRLDGIPLAIELAASRVGAYGLRGTADLLRNRLELLWQGRRSAPLRQQTLAAMVDWSFNLLSARDRRVLIRLSTFVGLFTLEAAQAVAADERINAMDVADSINNLINKSLIWVVQIDATPHHRLLDSTLAFGAEKLAQTAEANAVAKQHALYYTQFLSRRAVAGRPVSIKDVTLAGPYIGSIRAALEWSFSNVGVLPVGVQLAAAAAPLFFDHSLFTECARWCERGLAELPESEEGSAAHLTLRSFLAASAMFTRGNGDEVRRSIEDALSLAVSLGAQEYQMHLLVGLGIFMSRTGEFRAALTVAKRSIAVTRAIGSSDVIATRESMLGFAHHLLGDQASARRHCERCLMEAETVGAAKLFFFGYDHETRALIGLARCYWLIGFPDRAAKTARRSIDLAVDRDQPVSLCMTLIYTATVFLWRGDLDEADQLIRRLIAHAARHSLSPFHTIGLALTGQLAIARGNSAEGVALLRRALGMLEAENHRALTSALHVALAEGLLNMGEIDEAAAVVDAHLVLSEASGEALNIPELLRLRGQICLQTKFPDLLAAERVFQLSMEQAKKQSALSFELRSAMALARLWFRQDKCSDATDLLRGCYRRFGEGYGTADLLKASELLAELELTSSDTVELLSRRDNGI